MAVPVVSAAIVERLAATVIVEEEVEPTSEIEGLVAMEEKILVEEIRI